MKRKSKLLLIEDAIARMGDAEVYVHHIPTLVPQYPRERILRQIGPAVFKGELIPGTRRGYYRRKESNK